MAIPFGVERYDMLIKKSPKGGWKTVQVKQMREYRKGQLRAKVCGTRSPIGDILYRDGDFDLIAAVFDDKIWLLPWKQMHGKKYINLPTHGNSKTYNRWRIK